MPEERDRWQAPSFQHEEAWLRAFLEFHGTDGVTRFNEDDLGGVSLTRIVEVLIRGSVVDSEKCDGTGAICTVEACFEEEAALISVRVHFVANEEVLTVLSAEEVRRSDNEPDRAA
jgi:hypothetical protein